MIYTSVFANVWYAGSSPLPSVCVTLFAPGRSYISISRIISDIAMLIAVRQCPNNVSNVSFREIDIGVCVALEQEN